MKMIRYLNCCLLMTYDYNNIVEDLVILFNGGALKSLGERTHNLMASNLLPQLLRLEKNIQQKCLDQCMY